MSRRASTLLAALTAGSALFPGRATAGAYQVTLGAGFTVWIADGRLQPGIQAVANVEYLAATTTVQDFSGSYYYPLATSPAPIVGGDVRVGWQGNRDFWGSLRGTGGLARTWCCGYTGGFAGVATMEVAAGVEFALDRPVSLSVGAVAASVAPPAGGSLDYATHPATSLGADVIWWPTRPVAARLCIDVGVTLIDVHYGDFPPGVGRPLRTAGGHALPAAWVPSSAIRHASALVAQGRSELASVATFLRLERELTRLQAPAHLVARARQSAEEEARHAALCFDLVASRFGPVKVAPLPALPRRFADRREALRCHAQEALDDGIVGEAVAADWCMAQAVDSRDGEYADRQHAIATEETSHASYAADVHRWSTRVWIAH